METLSRDDFRTLARRNGGPRVSIYMPTARGGTSEADFLQLRNLARAAEAELIDTGMRPVAARELIEPVVAMSADQTFWHESADGLAVFLAERELTALRTPIAFRPLEVVGERCHLKPLLPLLDEDGAFLLLAISRNRCRVFEGDLLSMEEVHEVRLPEGILDALRFDDLEKQEHAHIGAASPAGNRSVQHGQGVGAELMKERMHRYAHEVDRTLRPYLNGRRTPMVLAGVGYEVAIYRSENTYGHLLEGAIEGNPDHMNAEALHERAWPLIEPHLRETVDSEKRQALAASGRGLLSVDLDEVLKAAHEGAIEVLFVASCREVWGTYDAPAQAAAVRDAREPGDEDLLDLAAVRTLLSGGKAHALPLEEMPGDSGVAALLRHR